jgi:hypothetical protein
VSAEKKEVIMEKVKTVDDLTQEERTGRIAMAIDGFQKAVDGMDAKFRQSMLSICYGIICDLYELDFAVMQIHTAEVRRLMTAKKTEESEDGSEE